MNSVMQALSNSLIVLMTMSCTLLGCTPSFRALDRNVVPDEHASIFVLGVKPANFRVQLFPGELRDNTFHMNNLRMATFFGGPEDGYVVGKADAGDVLAITMVRKVEQSADVTGTGFLPCGGRRTMVFKVPDAKIVYLGDVEYSIEGKTFNVRLSADIASANAYIERNFPKLKSKLQPVAFDLLPVALWCTGTVYNAVYIPVHPRTGMENAVK